MRIRLHIIASFSFCFALGLFQACGVDPLDTAIPGPSTNPQDKNYTTCEDPNIPDSDHDGVNDKCEELIGSGQPNIKDCNSNGVDDGYENLGPNCTPITDQTPCPPPGVNLTCDEYQKELDGKNNKNLNDLADPSLLANSGLNASAPNGTEVSVQKQFIRIVYNRTSSPANSGLQTSPSAGNNGGDAQANSEATINQLCQDMDNGNAQLETFMLYYVEGDVKYCTQDGCGPTKHAIMKMCAKLDLPSATPGTYIKQPFRWAKGWVKGEKYTGFFSPKIFEKDQQINNAKLTLIGSQITSGVYQKLNVKFENTFTVKGQIWGQDPPVVVDSTNLLITQRMFKRASIPGEDPLSSSNAPGMTGPWYPEE